MDPITDPRLAGERLLTYAREGRLVQNAWHDEQDGREVACLLGAAAGIDGPDECHASLMPAWVAHALPGLFDGQSEAHAITFAIRWGKAMVRPEWRRIDWDAVRNEWLAFVVQQAQDASAASAAAAYAAHAAAASAASAAAYAAACAAAEAAAATFSDADDDDVDAARAARATQAAQAACNAQAAALMASIERAMGVE
jgi:hypothetical protein